MNPSKNINLSNGTILKKICDGSKLNWIFLPGGPGIGEEYFEEILRKNFLKGNVYLLKFPKYISYSNDLLFYEAIQKDINEFLEILDNVIIIGHSFSGMLLQTLNLKTEQPLKIILLNSSPTLDCFEFAEKSFEKFSYSEKLIIENAEKKYNENKCNENFYGMFKAWAPYYVKDLDKNAYLKMLSICSYDFDLYEWGKRFFFKHFETNALIPDGAIIINSEHDKICPASLFENKNLLKITQANFKSLNISAHFPWIENSYLFINTLKQVEIDIDSLYP